MHTEDLKSRGAGVLCTVVGAGLTWWAWSSALGDGHYSLKAALVGPTLFVLGVGLLIHGRGIPTAGASVLTRLYGSAGGVATIVSLYLLGYFNRPHRDKSVAILEAALPFAMLFVWFLPSRVFGAEAPQPIERNPEEQPTSKPITPK